jgi:antitoxin ParD1/3/4
MLVISGDRPTGDMAMPTRNVVLTEHHESVIDRLVKSGRYQNASEVLRDGVRLVEQREAEDKAKLKALREAVQVGFDDIEAGRYKEFESFADLRRHLEAVSERAIKRGAARRRSA